MDYSPSIPEVSHSSKAGKLGKLSKEWLNHAGLRAFSAPQKYAFRPATTQRSCGTQNFCGAIFVPVSADLAQSSRALAHHAGCLICGSTNNRPVGSDILVAWTNDLIALRLLMSTWP